ncbi:MAG: hypothetical protein JW738_03805 [Actinobacteria bacterium]|nr:hypothetical protein [Actinomycetota bacterium]
MAKGTNHISYKKSGSRILWQITILVLVVFIISAGLSWFCYVRSIDDIVEDSKHEVVLTQAENMSSTFGYITSLLSEKMAEQFEVSPEGQMEMLESFLSKDVSQTQIDAGKMMEAMIEAGTLGMEEAFVVLPAGAMPVSKNDIIVMGSNRGRVYADVPENILPVFEGPEPYLFLENGIPEWRLGDEYLVVYEPVTFGDTGVNVYAVATKNMHEEIEEINSFYLKKQRRVNIIMAAVIGSSLIVLFIITFFVLRYLIKSRITMPIDELSEIAEQVMEGDLDVDINIRKGEEFEGLKSAFSKMLESLRDIMARAIEGE